MLLAIAQNLMNDSTSRRFAIGVCLGLGFSLSVILSTMGIMDGFETQLRWRLRSQVGDLQILSSKGLFEENTQHKLSTILAEKKIQATTVAFLKNEAFILKAEKSRAVLVIGVKPSDLSLVGKLEQSLSSDLLGEQEVPLWTGIKLAEDLKLINNEAATLALARGNSSAGGLPTLSQYIVRGTVTHGIHEKDSRIVYTSLALLQNRMAANGMVNTISVRLSAQDVKIAELNQLGREITELLGSEFVYRTYTSEYGTLLEAVQIEKWIITIILQIIVVISVFNVFAFLTFLNEQKSTVLFLVRALGLDRRQLIYLWILIVGSLWFFGCILALAFEFIFDQIVTKWGIIELPSDIYHLSSLSMMAPWQHHVPVFLAALVWILMFGWWYSLRYRGKALMMGLRKEFA
jgi:ABC-type lipoprotein release transport system permease subunit